MTIPRRYEHLSRIRLEDPEAVARAAATRRRHPGLKHSAQNFIVAADHPARGCPRRWCSANGHGRSQGPFGSSADRVGEPCS